MTSITHSLVFANGLQIVYIISCLSNKGAVMKKIYILLPLLFSTLLTSCGPKTVKPQNLVVQENLSMFVNRSLKLDVTVLPSDTTDKTLTYSIADPAIATISEKGIVNSLKIGQTTINVSVKSAPKINKEISLLVSEKYWPNEIIEDMFGFTLPEFPDYSSISLIVEDDKLEISLKDINNDIDALADYDELLSNLDWIAEDSNDSHSGTYEKVGVEAIILYHNHSSHNANIIEFIIGPKGTEIH